MKHLLFFILYLFLINTTSKAQYEDARWVLGYFSQLNFMSGTTSVFENGIFATITGNNNASFCNKLSGDILIYCHGNIIYNKLGIAMDNGDSINPGKYFSNFYPADNSYCDGVIILPNIYHNNQYFVFYSNSDSIVPGQIIPTKLYYSLVDMSYDNGLGKVIQKDVTVLNHLLEPGRLNAIQHANGKKQTLPTTHLSIPEV